MTSGRTRTPRRRAKRGVQRAAIDAAIAAGRKAPLTRGGIAALRDAHAADALEVALQGALEAGEADVATGLALALAAHGQKIPESSARRLLPDVERLEYVPLLVAHADADPLALMESLISQREQTVEADAVMAAIAARSFTDGVPPRWVPLLRSLCMDALPADDASLILGGALASVAKDELAALLVPHVVAARSYDYDTSWIAHNYECTPLEALPEQPRPKVIAEGFTLRRGQDAKVGRNDPCPCGSGKKYKKCCAAKDASAAGRAAQLDPSRLTPLDLERMRPRELVRLDPQRLSLPALHKNLEQLAAFRRWREVERALDALESRAEPDVTIMERLRVIQRALAGGAFDVAERQQELLPAEARDDPSLQATWAVARPSAESLGTLDAMVEEGLMSGEPDWFFDVAFPLLDHAPALGVVFARGCMGLGGPDDDAGHNPVAVEVQTLLMDVELVRVELGLDERDDAHEILAAFLERATWADEQRSAIAKAAKGEQKLRAALDEAKEQLESDRARLASLETQRRTLTEELESARAAGALDPHALEAERRAARARMDESEEDRRSLRARVEELKALLKESSEERAELRRELRRITALGEDREAPLAPAAQESPSDETSSHPSELPSQATRVPSMKKNAAEALLTMPAKASRAALESIAALASGDAIAWRAAKRMQGVDDVWSARVGIHHRLLYRIADDTLEVLEFVTRESLDTVLMRYRRGA